MTSTEPTCEPVCNPNSGQTCDSTCDPACDNDAAGCCCGAGQPGAPDAQAADAAVDGAAEGSASPADAAQRLAELQTKHAEVSDAYLRAKAECENIRRRAQDETAKARKFAIESFAQSLLPVLDSLDAALLAAPSASVEQLREGSHAIQRQLLAALERNKIVEVNPPAGTKFDPHQHQAISVVPLAADAAQDANTVVTVLQKGYLLAERVLRPAMVTVAAPK